MKKHQCPKCRNYFPREGLVIMKGLGICIDCSKGNSGIVRKIPERRYNKNVPKTNKADKNREISISPRLVRFLEENGYKKTAFGVYRKLGNGVTEVHYYQNFDELERCFEKHLNGGGV